MALICDVEDCMSVARTRLDFARGAPAGLCDYHVAMAIEYARNTGHELAITANLHLDPRRLEEYAGDKQHGKRARTFGPIRKLLK